MGIARRTTRAGRGARIAAVGVTAAVVGIGSIGTAWAVTPTWEPGGYSPTCDLSIPSGLTTTSYYDFTKPSASLAVTKVIAVGTSSSTRTLFKLRTLDKCSGVGFAQVFVAKNGTLVAGVPLSIPTDSSHDHTTTFPGTFSQADVGKWTYPSILVVDRFESFELDGSTTLGTVTNRTGTEQPRYAYSTTQYAGTATYVLRQTKATVGLSRTSITKGSSVTVNGRLTVASGASFVNLAGQKVTLQRRIAGTTTWFNVGTVTSSSTGWLSLTSKPGSSSYYRWVYAGKYSSPWNAPITSSSTTKLTVG